MDEMKATGEPVTDEKQVWKAPELTTHGGFRDLTQFTAGTGPDDGFFDPGAAASAA
jgi:hypothetical protein